jgi:hypothetical protein
MSSYREEVQRLVLGTLWSLWAELGLSGWERWHRNTLVDLEALIVATARMGERDPRLLEEALDWCIANGRIASAVRFKHLVAAADGATRQAFERFAGTVNAHAPLRWPSAGPALRASRTGRSASPDLSRPALLQLRLRALWGVNARAEVLRVMLPEGGRFMGVSEVSLATAYGKDAVSDALDSLQRGGLLARAGRANQYLYRLVREDELRALVGSVPVPEVDWSMALPVMVSMLEAAELPETPPLARAAELHRRYRTWQPPLARMGNTVWPQATGEEFNADYERWSLQLLRRWAGDAPVTEARPRHVGSE